MFAGVARAGTATVFPQAIALAATWNPKLVKKVATAISDEARAKYNEARKFGDTQQYQVSLCGRQTLTSSATRAGGAAMKHTAKTRI